MSAFGSQRRAQIEADMQAFADAVPEDDTIREYQRRAQARAWRKVMGQPSGEFSSRLRLELPRLQYLDAARAGDAAAAVQRAVATYGAYMAKRAHVQRLSTSDIERVHLVQFGQDRNVIWLGLPAQSREQFPLHGARSADTALRGLLEQLPREPDDRHAVDGILGALQPIRKAVDEIAGVGARHATPVSLSLLDGDNRETHSYLTLDAAVNLHKLLTVETPQDSPEEIHGVVDGMRTSRSTLYLVRHNGKEVSVHIEEHQRQQVIDLIRHRVVARVMSRVLQTGAGTHSRKVYRLLSITSQEPGLLAPPG